MLINKQHSLVLTLKGYIVTIRQQDENPDVHTTTQVVSSGDTIMYQGTHHTVGSVVQEETTEQKIARLEAELAKLKTGK